jgi:hypothetical protein
MRWGAQVCVMFDVIAAFVVGIVAVNVDVVLFMYLARGRRRTHGHDRF